MPVQTISNGIFSFLADMGVDRVFLVPGGGNMFLVDAVGCEPRIEFVSTHHEQAAVIAAEYYSRKTGKLGVAVVTTGPGSSNAVTGIAGAWFDSVPVLILAGQVKKADYNLDSKLRQRGPQEIDLVSMVAKITKMAKTCFNPSEMPRDLKAAVHLAQSGRPGPVVLEVPLDVQSAIIKWPAAKINNAQDGQEVIDCSSFSRDLDSFCQDLANQIVEAERPLVVVGFGVKSSLQTNSLRDLILSVMLPVSLTWPTTDFLSFDHVLNAGRFGVVAKRHANIILQKSDLILVLGSRLDNIQTAFNIERFGKNARVFAVDIDPAELKKMPERFQKFQSNLSNFVPAFSNAMAKTTVPETRDRWLSEISFLRQKFENESFETVAQEPKGISIYKFVDYLSNSFSGGEIIVTGSSGLAVEVFYTHFRNREKQWIGLTTGLGAMGYGLPAALGVAAASKDKVFLFESDGSLMMNLQELQSLKTLAHPVTIFVQNNDGYASIRATQENYFNGRFVATGPSSRLEIPSIKKLAEAFGFEYAVISSTDNIEQKLATAREHKGLMICEVVLWRDEKLMPKCSVIRTEDNQMISAPLEDMNPLLDIETLKSIMGTKTDELSLRIRN
jgi:acetolactate synthase-1/2/3 large subunit